MDHILRLFIHLNSLYSGNKLRTAFRLIARTFDYVSYRKLNQFSCQLLSEIFFFPLFELHPTVMATKEEQTKASMPSYPSASNLPSLPVWLMTKWNYLGQQSS